MVAAGDRDRARVWEGETVGPKKGYLRLGPPQHATKHDDAMSYVVWSPVDCGYDDGPRWRPVAAFRHLQEAIDFMAYLWDRGCEWAHQSPAGVQTYKPTDRRPVYNGTMRETENGPIVPVPVTA